MNYRELKQLQESLGPQQAAAHLRKALSERQLRPEDFSLRTLAESLIPDGREFLRCCRPGRGGVLMEAVESDVSAFASVAGELLSAKVMEGYQQEEFVASRIVRTIPTMLDGERLSGLASLGDAAEPVEPGQPYPKVGLDEDFIETPSTQKRGLICTVTREALFFDRTHPIYEQAFRVGEALALAKEKRILDVLLGLENPYNHRGTRHDTYQTSTPWVNVASGNELVDWTQVDVSEQVFASMVDPNTGEPILIRPKTLFVMPAKFHAARAILNATEVRIGDGAGHGTQTISGNLLQGYSVVSSRLAYRRLVQSGVSESAAKRWWFHADFARAFAYMENWPITVVQAPPNSVDEFERDVVLQVKASERGVPAVLDPRCVVKNTG